MLNQNLTTFLKNEKRYIVLVSIHGVWILKNQKKGKDVLVRIQKIARRGINHDTISSLVFVYAIKSNVDRKRAPLKAIPMATGQIVIPMQARRKHRVEVSMVSSVWS